MSDKRIAWCGVTDHDWPPARIWFTFHWSHGIGIGDTLVYPARCLVGTDAMIRNSNAPILRPGRGEGKNDERNIQAAI